MASNRFRFRSPGTEDSPTSPGDRHGTHIFADRTISIQRRRKTGLRSGPLTGGPVGALRKISVVARFQTSPLGHVTLAVLRILVRVRPRGSRGGSNIKNGTRLPDVTPLRGRCCRHCCACAQTHSILVSAPAQYLHPMVRANVRLFVNSVFVAFFVSLEVPL